MGARARIVIFCLAWLAFGVIGSNPASASSAFVDGISDQSMANWDNEEVAPTDFMNIFKANWISNGHVKYARYVVQWNVQAEKPGNNRKGTPREKFEAWYKAALSTGLTLDVSFANYHSGAKVPSAQEYYNEIKWFLDTFQGISYVEPWNEPNLSKTFFTVHEPKLAAEYANEAGRYCAAKGCTVIDGGFSDIDPIVPYAKEYIKHLNSKYETGNWGVHVYDAIKDETPERIEHFKALLKEALGSGQQVWLTEGGAYKCQRSGEDRQVYTEEMQAEFARYFVRKLIPTLAPAHVFYYSFLAGDNNTEQFCTSPSESQNTALYEPSSEYIGGGDPNVKDAPRPAATFIQSDKEHPWAYSGGPPTKALDVATPEATLTGSIYPGQQRNAEYYFEFWPEGGGHVRAGGGVVPYKVTYKSGGGNVTVTNYRQTVSTRLTGLAPGTHYHYRLVAIGRGVAHYGAGDRAKAASAESEANEEESAGETESFKTQPKPEAVTEAALSVSQSSEVLKGHVNPEELDTKYYFEYGHTTAYGSTFNVNDAGSGTTTVPAAATLMGLEADSTYHYRLVAESSAGRTNGADVEFHTTAWDTMYLPRPAEAEEAEIHGVSCAAPSACTAVGQYSKSVASLPEPLTERWDGTGWTSATPTLPENFRSGALFGVSCVSREECLGVGWYEGGTSGESYRTRSVASRWNGSEWHYEPVAESAEASRSMLWSTSCVGSTFCMAAGETRLGENSYYVPYVDQWSSGKWRQELLPMPIGGGSGQTFSISCASTVFCVAAGRYIQAGGGNAHAFVDRWNGSEWQASALSNPTGTTEGGLFGVSCISTSQCMTVGEYKTSSGESSYPLAEQWNGSSWALQTPPSPPETRYSDLWSVSCTSGPVCTAVGRYGNYSFSDVLAGGVWSFQPVGNPPGTKFNELNGVSCLSSTECVAAGTLAAESEPLGNSDGFADMVGPDAETQAATEIGAYSARLEGVVNPLGLETNYRFEYGATNSYGTRIPLSGNISAGKGVIDGRESQTVGGLTPETTYHYRIVAESTSGRVSYGEDIELMTAPLVPSVVSVPSLSSSSPVQNETDTISTGSWTYKPKSYTYQWERCNSAGGECVVIEQATLASYTPGEEDIGSTLKAVVTATNIAGSTSTEILSGVVALGVPLDTSRPALSGYTATPASELSVTPNAWTGKPTYTYQWQLCNKEGAECSNIFGSTGSQLTVDAAQVGDSVRAEVTATNAAGTASMPTLPAEIIEVPSDVTLPGLSSTAPVEDVALTAVGGTWKGYPAPQYTYQWERCNGFGGECEPIEEATEESYVPGEQDLGHTLRLEVTGSNGAGQSSAKSEVSGLVVQEAPTVVEAPSVAGEAPAIGAQQTADTGTWTDRPASYSYQWFDCATEAGECTSIAGATAATYVPVRSDVGKRLAVQVIATNGVGSSLAARSAVGGPVGGAPASTTMPSLSSGSAYYRVPLSATSGSWSAYPAPSYAYQWQRCSAGGGECSNIASATSSSYTPALADVGRTVRAQVEATNSLGSATAVTAPSGVVAGLPTVGWGADSPAGEGSAQEMSDTLNATVSSASTLSSISCSVTSRYPDGTERTGAVSCATTNNGASGSANWSPEYFVCSASAYQSVDPEPVLSGGSRMLPYGVSYTYTVSASNVSGASTVSQSWSPERCAMQWKNVAAHNTEGGELPLSLGGYSSYSEAVLAHKYEYSAASEVTVTVEDNAEASGEHAWYVEAYVNGTLVGKLSNLNVRHGREYEPLSVLVPAGGNLELRGNLYTEAHAYLSATALNVTGGTLTVGGYTAYAEASLAHKYEYSSPTEAVITAQDIGSGGDEHPWYVEAYVNGTLVGKLSNLNVRTGTEYEPLSVLVPAGGNLELRGNLYTEAKAFLSTSALSVSGGALTMGTYSTYSEATLAHKYEYATPTEMVITAQDNGAGGDEHPWYVEAYVNGVLVGKLSNLNVRSGIEYEPVSVLVPAGGTLELRGNLYSEGSVYLSGSALNVVGTGPLNFGPYSAFAEAVLAHKYEYSAATEAVVTVEDNGLSGDEHPWYVEAYVNGVMAGKLSNLNVRSGQEYETLSVLVPAGGNLELKGNLYTEAKAFLSTSSWTETGGSVTVGGYTPYTEATLAHKYTYASPTEAVITAEDNAKSFDEEPWYVEAYVNGSLVGKLSNLNVRYGQEYEPLSVLVPANGTLELRGNLYKEGKAYLSTSSVTVSRGTFTVGARTPYSEGSLAHKYEYATASEVAVTVQDNGSTGDEHPWYVEAYVGGVLVAKLSNLNVRSGTEDEPLTVFVPATGNLELRGNLYTEAKVFLSSSTLTVSGLGEGVIGTYTAYAPGRPVGALTKAYCLTYSTSSGEYSPGAGGSGENTTPAWGNCSPAWGSNTTTSTPVSVAWQNLAATGASCLYMQTISAGGATPVVGVQVYPHEPGSEFNAASGNGTCPAASSPQAPAAVEGSPPTVSPSSPHVNVAETATKGSWTNYPASYAYQWQQCNSSGEACGNISGATSASYTPLVGNAGHTLRVVVTATNPLGSASATSPATGVVSGAPENKTLPTITGTTSGFDGWSAPQTIDGTSAFNAISCPSTGLCVAVDAAKDILTSTNAGASWTLTSASAVFPYQPPSAASCSTVVFCAAFDGNANLATSTNPTGGASAWTYSSTPIPGGVSKTTCVSSTLCLMTEAGNIGWSATPATGSSWKYESLGTNTLNAISCPTSSFCAIVDNAGNLLTATNPTGGAAAWTKTSIDGTAALKGISCPTGSFCAAVDSTGNLLTSTNPTGGAAAWTKTSIDGTTTLNAISCPSSSFCAAVDSTGHALTSTNPTGGASAWTSSAIDSSWSLTGVSCASSSFCAAVDNDGHETTFYEGLTTVLSASTGTWTNEPSSYSYQWKRCNTSGEECTNIEGATTSTHVVIPTDNGHTIRVVVTASNAAGSTGATSTQTGTVVTPGEISEYTLPAGSKPYGISTGPDGNLWFTAEGTGKIGKITTSGTISAEYATNNDSPEGITQGPDGNLWLVEHSVRNIDHITTGGTLTTYTLTRTGTYNVGIATGPDNNLWFTESSDNYVGKINTKDEVLAEYPLPAGSEPYGITAGPDGNLWYADHATSKIGKITTSGTITEYTLPSGSQPYWITTGQDGNLWFTEAGNSKIGKITTSGTITEYALPTGSQPYGIAAGSDGAIWFTDHHTNRIGRITTTGSIAEIPLPAGSEPAGIAPGPNNNLWYTDYTTSKIGQITP